MSFYQLLQLDPAVLKNYIRNSEETKEKRRVTFALVLRSMLLVAFAIVFISIMTMFFNEENSAMAVVFFCMLLSLRFVGFGYKISHSLCSLAIVCSLLLVSPVLMQNVSPIIGFFINVVSLFVILLLTTKQPEMGNAGLYMFGYVFLSASPISFPVFVQRAYMTLVGFLICALILYRKHKHKDKEAAVHEVFTDFRLADKKNQWQLCIAVGLSCLFYFGRFVTIDKFVWIAFACSSLLSTYTSPLTLKMKDRMFGIIVGSLLFAVVYMLTPDSLLFLFGPLAGLCLGFCGTYKYKTVFNCFGALLMGVVLFGLPGAVMVRIGYNFIGLLFGIVFYFLFTRLIRRFV